MAGQSMTLGRVDMGTKATVWLTDDDEALITLLKRRLGQKTKSGVMRQCLHMIAEQKGIRLDVPELRTIEGQPPRE